MHKPEDFRRVVALDRERGYLKDGADAWGYIRRSRDARDQQLLFTYAGPEAVVNWMAHRFANIDGGIPEPKRVGFWDRPTHGPHLDGLVERSSRAHELLLRAAAVDAPAGFHAGQDVYNAQDFHYCTALTSGVQTVLDFGAGYGRQAILFTDAGIRYIATDAVEQPYLLQEWTLEQLELGSFEYLDDPDASPGGQRVVHLPSWRLDLLPDDSIDLAMFVWSIHEMSRQAARAALSACARIVRPGGYIYVRDERHRQGHRENVDALLARAGFRLMFDPLKLRYEEMHGIPRLYRNIGARRSVVRRAASRLRRYAL